MKEEYIPVADNGSGRSDAPEPRPKLSKPKLVFVIAILIMVLLIYLTSFTGGRGKTKTVSEDTLSDEQRLCEILSSIKGAGNVNVMITYESTAEIVPAMSIDESESSSTDGETVTDMDFDKRSEPASSSDYGDSGALVLKELAPTVRGVVITAEGADDLAVRFALSEAAGVALNVDESKICVYTMERNED